MTVKQVIGKDWETAAPWRKVEGSVMEGLFNKGDKDNFSAHSNRTLVTLNDTRVSEFVTSYSKVQSTSSYLRHPDHPDLWRPFTSEEIAMILGVPTEYQFPEFISETNRTALLGQSVACNVIQAIGIEVAFSFMAAKLRENVASLHSSRHLAALA